MSRLPKLRSTSSPTGPISTGPTLGLPSTITTRNNLKRKADTIEEEPDDDAEYQEQRPRRKIAALGTARPTRPLQPARTAAANGARIASGGSSAAAPLPKPLTKPRAPAITRTAPRIRGTSAPPTQRPKPPSANRARVAAGRNAGSRTGANSIDDEIMTEQANLAALRSQHDTISAQLAESRALDSNHRRELIGFSDEIEQLKKKHTTEIEELQEKMQQRVKDVEDVSDELRLCREDLERERENATQLRTTIGEGETRISEFEARVSSLEAQNAELRAQTETLEASLSDTKHHLAASDAKLLELKQEVVEAEFVRRKLHNMVQELKGNIRVFCRVRPILPADTSSNGQRLASEDLAADIKYPDPDAETPNMIQLTSSTPAFSGPPRKETHTFTFDRVFAPQASQVQVFEEIELLVQSVVDGYNVCVFAYGQTGSGKSWTMEGGSGEEQAGMIPRAVEQVFRVAGEMRNRGWEYHIEGEFLEIYNETIHDLLTKESDYDSSKKKHEIKHDPKTRTTRVTNITTVPLTSPSQVHTLLSLAHSRRSVAATLVNERSSRSHSVFILRISGTHVGISSEPGAPLTGGTGERCSGCLNLVDLAGSERLNVSFANGTGPGGLPEKERVKETQNINKSLSALGDVIAALGDKYEREKSGKGEGHVPYRNSKLTYLLQNSLSGSSKTLMFLNLSPLAVHSGESLTSLRFATKVNNTQIGSAKKSGKS
ncbi:hypothetical protein D9756_010534 [Leucocoprinus leucothites]|uniref:Kinesin motor domain-containing protein n=1 Tax=Leucocoprinus leucothites TaxID=201217 RepID=A0A8H5FTB6_9AGAR|nr:hypothetical protein D9756_010534 [Leucoagaricus leucothites]